ncbi:MAG: extradiol ring-cleavage dioxygenase [Thermoflavifilum sp.]|nr:extradiol ring-cleavage dioxygenase [Thermoflavifilum sp.]MCL6513813.1 extradiol ring-cleavage dioxygenase [Alicyclobacillus sp.]
MSLELAMISPHTPRICHLDRVPPVQQPMVDAMARVAEDLEKREIDALVIVSCHWMSSFDHYVDATEIHKGVLTAVECPDLISDVPYEYPGQPELARALVEAGKAEGLRVIGVDDPSYVWDYGTVVPLRHLLPRRKVPVVDLSVCWAASLDETRHWGRVIGRVLRESPLRTLFVCSGALAHNLVRVPTQWPNITEQTLDHRFIQYLVNGDTQSAIDMLPSYSRAAGLEAGGRHVAMLLGVLEGSKYTGELLAYGPSSGSGNPVLTLQPAG